MKGATNVPSHGPSGLRYGPDNLKDAVRRHGHANTSPCTVKNKRTVEMKDVTAS